MVKYSNKFCQNTPTISRQCWRQLHTLWFNACISVQSSFGKPSAPGEDRTHDLQMARVVIMRLTRYLLRYRGKTKLDVLCSSNDMCPQHTDHAEEFLSQNISPILGYYLAFSFLIAMYCKDRFVRVFLREMCWNLEWTNLVPKCIHTCGNHFRFVFKLTLNHHIVTPSVNAYELWCSQKLPRFYRDSNSDRWIQSPEC